MIAASKKEMNMSRSGLIALGARLLGLGLEWLDQMPKIIMRTHNGGTNLGRLPIWTMILLLLFVSVADWQRARAYASHRVSVDVDGARIVHDCLHFAGWANDMDFSSILRVQLGVWCVSSWVCASALRSILHNTHTHTTCGMRKFLSIIAKPAVLTRSLIRRAQTRTRNVWAKYELVGISMLCGCWCRRWYRYMHIYVVCCGCCGYIPYMRKSCSMYTWTKNRIHGTHI